MKVFVYGTLKSGYGNNIRLRGHDCLGLFTVSGYKLYNSGFPVARPSPSDKIIGEVWDIGDAEATLRSLDGLESEGRMYIRTRVIAESVEDGTSEEVQMYVGPEDFWRFSGLEECPVVNGNYEWSR